MPSEEKRRFTGKEVSRIILISVCVSGITLLLYGMFIGGMNNTGNCQPVVCSNVVCNGAISADFILQKIGDFEEVSSFCQSKGYNSGTGTGMRIFCSDGNRYKYFPVMTEFVPYLYEKYKPEGVK